MNVNLDPIQLIQTAWERFKLNPGLCIGMWIIYVIFQPGGGSANFNVNDPNLTKLIDREILITLLVVALSWTCITMVLGPIFRGGFDLAMLRVYRNDISVSLGDLFAGFPKAVPLFLTGLLFGIIVVMGFILCIVPGVILSLGLWPAFLLVMEDDLDPIAALKGAWALTHGHKLQLLILSLVCGLVFMVGFLACCVGVFVAGPVAQIAWVGAYDAMRGGAQAMPTSQGNYGAGFDAQQYT